jgi:uncharacterized membrane protein YraQ (UPF0718 family)
LVGRIGDELALAGSMAWEIFWALILGFLLSAMVQAVARTSTVVRLFGDNRPVTGQGGRTRSRFLLVLLRRGRPGPVVVPQRARASPPRWRIGSTNLVIELSVITALLLGWQFTIAEFIGGPIMMVLLAGMLRLLLRARLVRAARKQAGQGPVRLDGGARGDGHVCPKWRTVVAVGLGEDFTAVAHVFVMAWPSILHDLVIGLLIAGAIGAWVPDLSAAAGFSLPET